MSEAPRRAPDIRRRGPARDANGKKAASDDRQPLPLREEHRLLTRSRLVEAGIAVFADKGYIATTVEDIVAAAGASRATFYLHFESKLALLLLASEQHIAWAPATLHLADGTGPVSREKVRAMVVEAFKHWREHASLLSTFMQAESVEPQLRSALLPNVYRSVDTAFPEYLGQFAGPERERVRTELMMLTLLAYRYMFYEFVSEPYPSDLNHQIEAMTDLFWHAMSARAAAPEG